VKEGEEVEGLAAKKLGTSKETCNPPLLDFKPEGFLRPCNLYISNLRYEMQGTLCY
jgi:hypothetical protein